MAYTFGSVQTIYFILEESHNTSITNGQNYVAKLLHKRSMCKLSANLSIGTVYWHIPLHECANLCGVNPGGLFAFIRPNEFMKDCGDGNGCDCICINMANVTDEEDVCQTIQDSKTDLYKADLRNATGKMELIGDEINAKRAIADKTNFRGTVIISIDIASIIIAF